VFLHLEYDKTAGYMYDKRGECAFKERGVVVNKRSGDFNNWHQRKKCEQALEEFFVEFFLHFHVFWFFLWEILRCHFLLSVVSFK